MLINIFEILKAYIIADFLMGLYHWIKDTYFTPLTPIIGKIFIWNSRLHHIKPLYVTTFSDWNIFINSALWTSIWIIPLILYYGPTIFILTLFFIISINDIIHKYAHLQSQPYLIKILQKFKIIQSCDEHHIHHLFPYIMNYCPISPYLNIILENINFWRILENIILYFFKIKPRLYQNNFLKNINFPAEIEFI